MKNLIPAKHIRHDEDGAALLELTVIMPFLIVLGLGIFEFSNMLYQYHLITGGVRDAGRYAAGLPMGDPAEKVCTSPAATPVGCAKHLAVFGEIKAGTYRVGKWWNVEQVEMEYVALSSAHADLRGGIPTKVVVSTNVEYDDIGFLDALGLGPITIATSHEERHYGVR